MLRIKVTERAPYNTQIKKSNKADLQFGYPKACLFVSLFVCFLVSSFKVF